jgi:perosamine synthetase
MRHIAIAHPMVDDEEIQAVTDVLRSGILAQGPVVKQFEEAFARSCGVSHAIATNNGTSALHSALLAAEIGPGDEVIVPTFTFFATASAVSMCGATPVFADVHEASYNIDTTMVPSLITSRTKAIIGVHLFGQPFDAAALRRICDEYDLLLIEDAAQAHGARYRGQTVGAFGDLACFSFYATKNMLTGEGGMVTTHSDVYNERLRSLINHGQQEKYLHIRLGYNYRMTDLAAAIGLVQLSKLEGMNAARQKNAAFLDQSLVNTDLILPKVHPEVTHVYHQYVVRVPMEMRDGFSRSLQERGVSTAIHYPRCLHEQPYYSRHAIRVPCPVGERVSKEVVSLPVHPALTEEDLQYLSTAIGEVI